MADAGAGRRAHGRTDARKRAGRHPRAPHPRSARGPLSYAESIDEEAARLSRVERDQAVLGERVSYLKEDIAGVSAQVKAGRVETAREVQVVRSDLSSSVHQLEEAINGREQERDDERKRREREQREERRSLRIALVGLSGTIVVAIIGALVTLLAHG